MSNEENKQNVNTELNSKIGDNNEEAKKAIVKERKRIKKAPKPATSAKLTEADKVEIRHKQGFTPNLIAAQLMIPKSRVLEILTSKNLL